MDQNMLLYVMTAFVIIAAIALCIQAGMLVAVYKATKQMSEKVIPLVPKVESLIPRVESLIETSKVTVEQSRKQIAEISSRTNEILDSTKHQLALVEEVVT